MSRRRAKKNPFETQIAGKRWLSEEIGKRLLKARKQCGRSQEDVAHETTITRSHLANLEAGNGFVPSLETLYSLAASLEVSAKDLLP